MQAVQDSSAMSPPDVEFDITCPSNQCLVPEHWSLTTCVDCVDESLSDTYSVDYKYEILFDYYDSTTSAEDRPIERFTDIDKMKERMATVNYTSSLNILWRPQLTKSGNGERLLTEEQMTAVNNSRYIFGNAELQFLYSNNDSVDAPLQGSDVFKIMEWITILPSPPLPRANNLTDWSGSEIRKRTCRTTLCSRRVEETQVEGGIVPPAVRTYVPLDIEKRTDQELVEQTFTAVPRGYPDGPRFDIQGFPLGLIVEDASKVLSDPVFASLRQCVNQTVSFKGLMVGLSGSINKYLTSPTNNKAETLPAKVFGAETFVVVRWWWAIAPCLIVLSTLGFLIATIIDSRMKQELFKSSVLTGYFHGLEGWSEDELGEIAEDLREREREAVLTEKAKSLKARLMRSRDGNLKFVKSD
jgi:hypothetical protein